MDYTKTGWVYRVPVGWRGSITSTVIHPERGSERLSYAATATGDFSYDEYGTLRRRFTNCEPLINGESDILLGEPSKMIEALRLEQVRREERARKLVQPFCLSFED